MPRLKDSFPSYRKNVTPAEIVTVGDTHGEFHGDGVFFLDFHGDKAEIADWLDQAPPWNRPRPEAVALACPVKRGVESRLMIVDC